MFSEYRSLRREVNAFLHLLRVCASDSNTNKTDINNAITLVYTLPAARRLSAVLLEKNTNLSAVPANQVQVLVNTALQIKAKENKRQAIVRQLIPFLQENQIDIILLKGCAFNGFVYHQGAPRGTSDIDILVRKKDTALLEAHLNQFAQKAQHEQKHPFDDLYESTWTTHKEGIHVDVHTALTNPKLFPSNIDSLFSDSISHPAYNSSCVRILSSEAALAHLATHVINDTNYFHYNLLDCHELVIQKQASTEKAFKIASELNTATSLYFLLKITADVFDNTALSKAITVHAPNKIHTAIANWIVHNILPIPAADKSGLHRIKLALVYCFMTDSFTKGVIFNINYVRLLLKCRLESVYGFLKRSFSNR